jgi:hypothetical protein
VCIAKQTGGRVAVTVWHASCNILCTVCVAAGMGRFRSWL